MKANFISDTVRHALESAGLTGPRGAGVTEVIEKALRDAGLSSPSPAADVTVDEPATGRLGAATFAGPHGSIDYKLYVPAGHDGAPLPLLVMLHGCKQNPDDFAAGTRMNEYAQRCGFLVAYPAQTPRANGSNCWNWFEPQQQVRGGREPALIAGIVDHVRARHAVAPGQVFAAGLSAGAAMAVVLGQTHPEVFAAVAAHSGLPLGAAHDVASAFRAMHGQADAPRRVRSARRPVRTLVFHGDADATVRPSNGAAIVDDVVQAYRTQGTWLEARPLPASGAADRCTATAYRDPAGRSLVEHWIWHGGSHAWSGGHPAGSYTRADGPDASRAIVRFLLERPV